MARHVDDREGERERGRDRLTGERRKTEKEGEMSSEEEG